MYSNKYRVHTDKSSLPNQKNRQVAATNVKKGEGDRASINTEEFETISQLSIIPDSCVDWLIGHFIYLFIFWGDCSILHIFFNDSS